MFGRNRKCENPAHENRSAGKLVSVRQTKALAACAQLDTSKFLTLRISGPARRMFVISAAPFLCPQRAAKQLLTWASLLLRGASLSALARLCFSDRRLVRRCAQAIRTLLPFFIRSSSFSLDELHQNVSVRSRSDFIFRPELRTKANPLELAPAAKNSRASTTCIFVWRTVGY
jgi:hypothetical protein